jgi:hypothetical protein
LVDAEHDRDARKPVDIERDVAMFPNAHRPSGVSGPRRHHKSKQPIFVGQFQDPQSPEKSEARLRRADDDLPGANRFIGESSGFSFVSAPIRLPLQDQLSPSSDGP